MKTVILLISASFLVGFLLGDVNGFIDGLNVLESH
jgi:hypothetical protein